MERFINYGNIIYRLDGKGDKIIRPRGLYDRAIIATQTLAIQELAKQATSSAVQTAQLSAENTQLKSAIAAQASAISALEARLAALESKS